MKNDTQKSYSPHVAEHPLGLFLGRSNIVFCQYMEDFLVLFSHMKIS